MEIRVEPEDRLAEIQVKKTHHKVNNRTVRSASEAMKSALSIVQFQACCIISLMEWTFNKSGAVGQKSIVLCHLLGSEHPANIGCHIHGFTPASTGL